MTFFGIGLHVIIALIFAVHALRTGKDLFWLFILFMFPLLGSIVYFIVIYLPDSKLQYGAKKAVSAAAKSLDPSRELREARAAYEYTPTVQNQMRLAEALLDSGNAIEALTLFEACLKGPYASDPVIQFGAVRAFVACGRYGDALTYLHELRATSSSFRPEQVSLCMARALAGDGQTQQAKSEFEEAAQRYGSIAVLVEYAVWALESGDTATAQRLQGEIEQTTKHWNKHSHQLNKPLLQRLNAAQKTAKNAS